MTEKICIVCKGTFWVKPYFQKTSKYCSLKCYWQSKKGKTFFSPKGTRLSEATKLKMSIAHKNKPLFKLRGRKFSIDHRNNLSIARKGKYVGVQHGSWKGGKIKTSSGYSALINPMRFKGDKRTYIREHRIIVEQHIGRPLKRTEQVHHLGKKSDNRSKMLMAFINQSAHQRFENNCTVNPKEIIFDGRKL